eukprot:6848638-Lingulodinium_polyedra.AAC.1
MPFSAERREIHKLMEDASKRLKEIRSEKLACHKRFNVVRSVCDSDATMMERMRPELENLMARISGLD